MHVHYPCSKLLKVASRFESNQNLHDSMFYRSPCALCIHRRKDIYTKHKETPIWDGNVWMKELSEWIRLILFHLVDFENVIVWKSLYVRLQSLFWIIQGSMWNHFLVMTSYSPPLCLCLQNTCMIIACAEFLDEKCTYSTKKSMLTNKPWYLKF